MHIHKAFLVTVMVMTVVTVSMASPVAQQSSDQDVFRAYSPGQYAHDGQPVYRTTPRLVAVRPGQTVLRAGPGGTVKRIRIAQAQPVAGAYSVEQQQPTLPAYAAYRPLQIQAAAPQPAATYYVQKQPTQLAPRPKARPAYVPQQQQQQQQQQEEQEEEYAADPNPQYNFSFDVKDDELTNYQNRQEEREGGVIKGSYSVVDPDGYVRTVTYTADSKNGFQAKVVREPTDVKVKFPVPTEAPEEQQHQQNIYRAATPVKQPASLRAQQISHFPALHQQQQAQYQAQTLYAQQHQQQPQHLTYSGQSAGGQPTYVVRRIPAGSSNAPRVVKVLRSQ